MVTRWLLSLGGNVKRTQPTPEEIQATREAAQRKRVELGLPAQDEDTIEYYRAMEERKAAKARKAKPKKKA